MNIEQRCGQIFYKNLLIVYGIKNICHGAVWPNVEGQWLHCQMPACLRLPARPALPAQVTSSLEKATKVIPAL